MIYQRWTPEQEQSLLDIFESTPGTLWDKAREVNKRWNNKTSGWCTKNLVTLVNKYHSLRKPVKIIPQYVICSRCKDLINTKNQQIIILSYQKQVK